MPDAPRGALHCWLVLVESPRMSRSKSAAVLLLSLVPMASALAAGERRDCPPPVLAALARELRVAHFVPGPGDDGHDPAGVVVASTCKRMPDDPKLNPGIDMPYIVSLPTYAATAWYHNRIANRPADLHAFLDRVENFATGD